MPRVLYPKVKCSRCGWEWNPTVEHPVKCPGYNVETRKFCNARDWDKELTQ